ncbi:MAG: DUF3891 family protein [Acidobacteria bacterium]|nr:DUF3891 family protein [Acidobacteriota bacterium]
MIIVADTDDGTFRLVTQPDHAHLAGQILSLWRADGLPANPRRRELIFAGRQHDNGWREADAAPRCAKGGLPVDFRFMAREQRIEIWERGTTRFLERRPYAALLIVRHARELHRDRRHDPGWRDFLGVLARRERELRRQLRIPGRTLAADYLLLDVADTISLAACIGSSGELDLPARGPDVLRGRFDGETGTVLLSPLPLARAATFRVLCRRIPLRCYRGDADLGGELAAARWQEFTVRLAGDP